MQSSIAKLGLTVLVTLLASKGFAVGEKVDLTYKLSGPTHEIGDENTLTFTPDGKVVLTQVSIGRELVCEGPSHEKNGVLSVLGTCSDHSKFELTIDLKDVKDIGYFRTTLISKKIYPKPVQMEFLLK
ncbi:hypothetical protein ACLVWU_14270 [Bdellovibrio sp. HCB290]|uniref:hypothetical protein n=1 Tax=Bdellovibrio sp. HCB290 TaxID=3394356 RepID=UPI0039B4C350